MNHDTPSALPDNIPELNASGLIQQVPERIAVALDARRLEKAMVADLVQHWLQALQPEMEKMARDIVQRSAEEYWHQRSSGQGGN